MKWESSSPNYLEHYQIKGAKHGVRRFQNEDGSYTPAGRERYGIGDGSRRGVYDKEDGTKDMNRLKNDAKKDAEEYARAKAYYGEGAGNRRKQIRNRISERMKDPDYKKEFDTNMKNQDMSKHQQAANRERKWEDTKNAAAKTARGIKNILLGVGTASVTALGLVGLAKATGADKKIAEWGKQTLSKIGGMFKKQPSVLDYDWHPRIDGGGGQNGSGGGYSNATLDFLNRRH